MPCRKLIKIKGGYAPGSAFGLECFGQSPNRGHSPISLFIVPPAGHSPASHRERRSRGVGHAKAAALLTRKAQRCSRKPQRCSAFEHPRRDLLNVDGWTAAAAVGCGVDGGDV